MISWSDFNYNYFSFVFSWELWKWLQGIKNQFCFDDKEKVIGGPAVIMNKEWISKNIKTNIDIGIVYNKHNELYTRTSIGCIRKCSFCSVSKIEGELKELNDWEVKPIVIDNNLLACSKKHFDKVIDSLKKLDWCDFNQGLDARLLTKYHTERFSELKNPIIRLAWDNIKTEKQYFKAYELLKKQEIKNIRTYVLIGHNDTPEDALYRLEILQQKKIITNPMRYQPLDTKIKNEYVDENWTDKLLKDYMRFFSRTNYLGKLKFSEYQSNYKKKKMNNNCKMMNLFKEK